MPSEREKKKAHFPSKEVGERKVTRRIFLSFLCWGENKKEVLGKVDMGFSLV